MVYGAAGREVAFGTERVLDRAGVDRLVEALIRQGYRVIGPTVRDGAIVLAELTSGRELPAGWGVDTGPGVYRLRRRGDAAVFAHSAGPQSWKQLLHPPRQQLFSTDADGSDRTPEPDPARYALLGVRGCDLAAIGILDGVLGAGAHPDGAYAARRRDLLIVAVNCTEPGGVCFCASMGCGPAAGPGYDLALTELIDSGGHRFVAEAASEAGASLLADLPQRDPRYGEVAVARAAVIDAADRMGRQMLPLPQVVAAAHPGLERTIQTEPRTT